MKTKIKLLFAIAFIALFSACSDEDPAEIIKENEITIDGEEFTSTNNEVTKFNDGFEFSLTQGNSMRITILICL